MVHKRSFTAFQGVFILLLGILTFFTTDTSSYQVARGDISHKRLIKRLESSLRSPDESTREQSLPVGETHNDSFLYPRASPATWNGPGQYELRGTTGVSAMQMSVVDDRYVIIFDKAEHNPLKTSDGNNAWSALYDSSTHTVRALQLVTNSFCAGELYPLLSCIVTRCFRIFISADHRWGWLGNGTLINYGGNPMENIPSGNGIMGIRLFTPQPDGGGEVFDDPTHLHLTSNR